MRLAQKIYRNSKPGFHRSRNLRNRYGLTLDDLQAMVEQQDFACPICDMEISNILEYKTDRTVVVDHNHETGEVRGILCSKCNLMLGNARESTEILYKSIVYLSERGAYRRDK